MDQCKPVLLGLSLAGNLVKPLMSLYGTAWRERGYGRTLRCTRAHNLESLVEVHNLFLNQLDSSEICHRLLLISFGKIRFKPLTI
jgi:hypothetical protein